ncbi:MAG: hypothetical protein P8I99_03020 [Acidimicrobiales bacterium]|nr:hypothetical protein [Acidimicrobiales bacterium]MDG1876368.1 hypothetical protein [Acidimicrobiales bacterium]
MSVDTHTKGRTLDSYARARAADVIVLIDPDLASLPVEISVKKAGLFGRGVAVVVDGVDGAPCPINLI